MVLAAKRQQRKCLDIIVDKVGLVCLYNIAIYTYICGMLRRQLQRKTVHTFVMCAHFPDVHTLHLMLYCG